MKFRKNLSIMLLFCALHVCSACSQSVLPVPDYPLELDSVQEALAQTDFPFTVTELPKSRFPTDNPYQKAYELRLEDETLAASLSCIGGEDGGSRYLSIGFPGSFFSSSEEIPYEADVWKDALAWAAMLYGGFHSTTDVYDAFAETFETQTVTSEDDERIHGKWEGCVNDIHCTISYIQKKSSQETVLRSVAFKSDYRE